MSGKTLKDLKDRVDVVRSTQLERRLEDTKIGKYVSSVDDYVLTQLKSARGEVSIPTMQRFMELNPSYKNELEDLYIEKMKGVKGYDTVNVETIIAQAALFDCLCFVYDSKKDEYSLATMNFELLYDLDVEYDMLKQVLSKNKQGIVKAYRIDVEYSNSEKEFTFKAVNARDFDIDESKSDSSGDKRFFLVPYIFSVRFMKYIESALNKGGTLRVHQALNGVEKIRIISKNEKVLSQMCDVPEAVKGLEAKFFPLKGFFYAPVVGAPSTTSMVTNINLFDVAIIKPTMKSDFQRFNIHKPVDPIKDMIGESLVCATLMKYKEEDISDFSYMISNLPYRNVYLDGDIETIDEKSISKYLHSITETAKDTVYSVVGVDKELNRRRSLFKGNGRAMTKSEIENIEETLQNNICRVVIQKKDCKLSGIFCTNDKNVLRSIYGEDYIKRYEGFSTKFYIFVNWYNTKVGTGEVNEESIGEELDFLGLPSGQEDIKNVVSCLGDRDNVEDLKWYFAKKMGISVKRSEAVKSSSSVLARSLTAYINSEGKPEEYYKFVDKSKIISGVIF